MSGYSNLMGGWGRSDSARAAPSAALSAPNGPSVPVAEDQFFEGEPGLVSAFDFDYDLITEFQKTLEWTQFLVVPPAWISLLCCHPCFINQNVEWRTRAQHVALTMDGIRYVVQKRPSGCGLSCQDKGKQSKTVPYDKITDCDVQEPAGTACCCCIQNVLSEVTVDTASSGGVDSEGASRHELTLTGLKHPVEFKQEVWRMKRTHASGAGSPGSQPQAAQLGAPMQAEMNNKLLGEIRDDLKKMNASMIAKGNYR